jgi:CO/xanthine dehydrogenase Mo-binding subunit
MDMHATLIGAPVAQMQGLDKVAGRTRFAADVDVPGMLWGKMLRRPHPHARLRRMDAAAAWRVDVDYEVLPAVFDPRAAARPEAPLLHDDGASYAGAPLAMLATDVHNGLMRPPSRRPLQAVMASADAGPGPSPGTPGRRWGTTPVRS